MIAAGAAPAARGLPDRGARDRVHRRLHLHPRRVPGRVRDPRARASPRRAAAGLFGEVEITVYRGAGAYICGEETALLDSLEGRRGQPRPRPPFPPVQGLFSAPTADQQRLHDRDGAGDHRARRRRSSRRSASSRSPGTAIFSISGNVARPGNYELELGTPMRELIYDLAGGVADGRELKAVIPGGSSVPALSPDQIDVAARLRLARRARHVLRRRRR